MDAFSLISPSLTPLLRALSPCLYVCILVCVWVCDWIRSFKKIKTASYLELEHRRLENDFEYNTQKNVPVNHEISVARTKDPDIQARSLMNLPKC
jgi:hypothetical protein